jgi:hypothetical protein
MAIIHWTDPLELLVKKEAEKALALRWAHDEAQRWCSNWNTRLFFPSVILSVFSGAGSVGASNLLPFEGAATFIGIVSLLVGMLQTVSNYLAFAKRSESHRIASISYGKIHAHLAFELGKPRSERLGAEDVIDFIKTETDRLSEIAPQLPQKIKDDFHLKFGTTQTAIPTVLNGLEEVSITALSSIHENFTPRPVVRVVV